MSNKQLLAGHVSTTVPPLVVLDEPTAGLDADNRAHVLALVGSLCTQTASTVLFVTHRPDEREWWQRQVGGPVLTLGSLGPPSS